MGLRERGRGDFSLIEENIFYSTQFYSILTKIIMNTYVQLLRAKVLVLLQAAIKIRKQITMKEVEEKKTKK